MSVRASAWPSGADAAGIRDIYNHYVADSTTLLDLVTRTLDEQAEWIDEHSGGHPAVVAVAYEMGTASSKSWDLGHSRRSGHGRVRRPPWRTPSTSSPRYQGRGIGRLLLEEADPVSPGSHGFHSVITRIAGEQRASIELHARVRLRAFVGTEQRGRPQVRPLARRRGDAAAALGAG